MGVKIIDLIHDSALVEIPAKAEIIKEFGQKMNQWMINVPVELFGCPVPFKTDFEIGVNWGDLGGCEFDYNLPANAEVVKIENKDDTITSLTFNDWYTKVRPEDVITLGGIK